jgi:hypothetical protein
VRVNGGWGLHLSLVHEYEGEEVADEIRIANGKLQIAGRPPRGGSGRVLSQMAIPVFPIVP